VGVAEFRRTSQITVSVSPEQAVFTVGTAGEAEAFKQGARVLRRGPMFWGLYPGAPVFRTPGEALKYLAESGRSAGEAQVFKLSGEYDLDVDEDRIPNRINKSLAVVERMNLGYSDFSRASP
jgi:hypothetical protein